MDISIAEGARYGNPAAIIKKAKIRQKALTLPEHEQFLALIAEIENAGAWCSTDCANLVRFLAFGGFRKGEAETITWADCDFEKGEIVVRGDPETGTKNWSIRRVPMIPDMRNLLEATAARTASGAASNARDARAGMSGRDQLGMQETRYRPVHSS